MDVFSRKIEGRRIIDFDGFSAGMLLQGAYKQVVEDRIKCAENKDPIEEAYFLGCEKSFKVVLELLYKLQIEDESQLIRETLDRLKGQITTNDK